jgi:ATP-dependent helicase/nuclease subunit A
MSIHQSKGLEFPVVVLADLAHQFNEQDLRKNILLSDQWGLCLKAFPPGGEQRYETLPLFLARRRERGELRSEELRLLYVALTRARDTLLLVGTDTKAPPEPGRLELDPLNDITLLEQQNYLGWFKLWLPELVRAQAGDAAGEGQNDLVRWILYEANDARLARPADAEPPHTAVAAISEPPVPEEGVEAALQKWRERLAWQYPYEETRSIPAKTSATALRRQQADEEAATPKFAAVKHGFQEGPAADDCTGLSAAQKGTAHHRFLQHVALDCAGSDAGLRAEAERLRAAGLLSPKEHEALEMGALVRFWEGELGRQIRAEAVAVRRELPFTARFWLTELASLGLPAGAGAADDFVVVQGVADLVVLRPEEIWLLDFKTDAVEAATLPAKVKQYTLQLRLYAKALEKIHRRPVTRRWLHFLAMNETAAV